MFYLKYEFLDGLKSRHLHDGKTVRAKNVKYIPYYLDNADISDTAQIKLYIQPYLKLIETSLNYIYYNDICLRPTLMTPDELMLCTNFINQIRDIPFPTISQYNYIIIQLLELLNDKANGQILYDNRDKLMKYYLAEDLINAISGLLLPSLDRIPPLNQEVNNYRLMSSSYDRSPISKYLKEMYVLNPKQADFAKKQTYQIKIKDIDENDSSDNVLAMDILKNQINIWWTQVKSGEIKLLVFGPVKYDSSSDTYSFDESKIDSCWLNRIDRLNQKLNQLIEKYYQYLKTLHDLWLYQNRIVNLYDCETHEPIKYVINDSHQFTHNIKSLAQWYDDFKVNNKFTRIVNAPENFRGLINFDFPINQKDILQNVSENLNYAYSHFSKYLFDAFESNYANTNDANQRIITNDNIYIAHLLVQDNFPQLLLNPESRHLFDVNNVLINVRKYYVKPIDKYIAANNLLIKTKCEHFERNDNDQDNNNISLASNLSNTKFVHDDDMQMFLEYLKSINFDASRIDPIAIAHIIDKIKHYIKIDHYNYKLINKLKSRLENYFKAYLDDRLILTDNATLKAALKQLDVSVKYMVLGDVKTAAYQTQNYYNENVRNMSYDSNFNQVLPYYLAQICRRYCPYLLQKANHTFKPTTNIPELKPSTPVLSSMCDDFEYVPSLNDLPTLDTKINAKFSLN